MFRQMKMSYKSHEIKLLDGKNLVDENVKYQIEFGYLNGEIKSEYFNKVIYKWYKDSELPSVSYVFYGDEINSPNTTELIQLLLYSEEIMKEMDDECSYESLLDYLNRNKFHDYTEETQLYWDSVFR